jgi:hypothetical protein
VDYGTAGCKRLQDVAQVGFVGECDHRTASSSSSSSSSIS